MNNERRKEIQKAAELLRQAQGVIDEAKAILEAAKSDEEDYHSNMPESFQNGDKGERAQTAIDALDSAISDIEAFDFDQLENYLNDATE